MAERVRARFRLNSYTTEIHNRYPHTKPDGRTDYERPESCEKRTLNMTPVTGDGPDNKRFWEATPSGSLQLGVVNPEAWTHFEIGKEYNVDFSPVE